MHHFGIAMGLALMVAAREEAAAGPLHRGDRTVGVQILIELLQEIRAWPRQLYQVEKNKLYRRTPMMNLIVFVMAMMSTPNSLPAEDSISNESEPVEIERSADWFCECWARCEDGDEVEGQGFGYTDSQAARRCKSQRNAMCDVRGGVDVASSPVCEEI